MYLTFFWKFHTTTNQRKCGSRRNFRRCPFPSSSWKWHGEQQLSPRATRFPSDYSQQHNIDRLASHQMMLQGSRQLVTVSHSLQVRWTLHCTLPVITWRGRRRRGEVGDKLVNWFSDLANKNNLQFQLCLHNNTNSSCLISLQFSRSAKSLSSSLTEKNCDVIWIILLGCGAWQPWSVLHLQFHRKLEKS